MVRVQTGRASETGVARLLEAERAWQQSLAAARASAEAIVAAAEAEAQRADDASRLDTQRALDARRGELDAALAIAVREAEAALAGRADRYTNATDALIEELAGQALARAPWFVAVDAEPSA